MEFAKPDLQKTNQSIKPNQEEADFIHAQGLEEQEDYPAALKAYHSTIDSNPSKPILFECLKNMGNIYLKLGDLPAAEEAYCRAQRIDADHIGLVVNFGVLSMQKGDYQSAKEYFQDVLAQDTSSDIAWVGMGLVHRAHSDFDLARACLLRALDETPKNKTALTTYYHWCDDDQVLPSLEYIENYLKEEPNDQEIISLLNQHKSF